ncbi:MAG: ion channel [Planctomycetota bacterium]
MPSTLKSVRFRFRFYLALFLVALIGGVAGFMFLEGMSFANAFYFVIVTMSTVGYGDISAETGPGRWLTLLVIIMGVATFLGVVANATELILTRREQENRREKLNMVIGLFFSELGTGLLCLCAHADPLREEIRDILRVEGDWTPQKFHQVRSTLKQRDYDLEAEDVDLKQFVDLLEGQKEFVVGLLENPSVMEHETFTDVLWAVFHIADELHARPNVDDIPDFDRGHIIGDIQRAYRLLVIQWLRYMEHMQSRYPYLFSRAARINPFVMQPSAFLENSEIDND